MNKIYKINGKEIERINGGVIDFNGFKAENLTSTEMKINELLEALSDKEEECNCCGWDDNRYTHEPGCNLREEPKQIKLTLGKYALVDSKDFDELNKYKWTARKHGNTFYAFRNSKKVNGKASPIHMHRVIMNTPKGMVTDHIDGNGLNNQRKNLRVCTHAENMANRKTHINNTSGYKGVTWSKKDKKWRSQIYLNSKNIFLGHFTSKEEAYKTYIKACQKYHKEFANYEQ